MYKYRALQSTSFSLHLPSYMLVRVADKLQVASSGLGKATVSQHRQATIY
jgi:hypothetical protein